MVAEIFQDEVEGMEVSDKDRKDRLKRKRKRLEWQASIFCKGVMDEIIKAAVKESETRMCSEIVSTLLVDGS